MIAKLVLGWRDDVIMTSAHCTNGSPGSLRQQYDFLRDADRARWAWEWLSRNPDFRRSIEAVELADTMPRVLICREDQTDAALVARWGLHLAAAT